MKKRYGQLIRLRKWNLDALRRELVELEAMRRDLAQRIEALEAALDKERSVALEGVVHVDFGGYAAANLERRRRLEQSLGELDLRIEGKRAEVNDAFKEMKTIEIASERAAERERQKAARREQAFLDDLAVNRHRPTANPRV